MPGLNVEKKHKLEAGTNVVLIGLPEGFLDDLPLEDQKAITEVVGKVLVLKEYDKDGRGELEFVSADGHIHFIYLHPKFFAAQQ